jgi:hypothetical protein
MATLRTQALAAQDTFHVTSNVIRLASDVCLDVGMLEPEEVVLYATKLVNRNSPGLKEYGEHLANIFEAIERLGGGAGELRKTLDLVSLPPYDETKVTAMVDQTENGRRRISGEETLLTARNANQKFAEN